MIPLVKRIALFSLAIAAGAAAFVFVLMSKAPAAGICPTHAICYQNRTYYDLPAPLCIAYLNNGGTPTVCGQVSPARSPEANPNADL